MFCMKYPCKHLCQCMWSKETSHKCVVIFSFKYWVYRVQKNSMLKLSEEIRGTKNQDLFSINCVLYLHLCSAMDHQTVWLRLEIKQNYWSILEEEVIIWYQTETGCSNNWLRYTADSDTACLICVLKSARFLLDSCCYLNDSLQNQLVMCTSSFSCM
jgi:hypothetical protein